MASIRYNIIRLQVERPGQIVRFQHKIPSNLKRCTGFKAVHIKGIQTDEYLTEIGWITASFNNLKEDALVVPVSAQSIYTPEETFWFQSLDVHLEPNQLVVGVYIDTIDKNRFLPYEVNLYLRCMAAANEPIAPIDKLSSQKQSQSEPWLRSEFIISEEITADEQDENEESTTEQKNKDQLCMTT